MEKRERIKKNSQFRYIYKKGKSVVDDKLVVYIFKNNKGINRVGISVSKKVGKSVTRNKIKRLIREGYRLNKHRLKKGYDLVFVVRVRAAKASYKDIEKSILNLLRKGGLQKEGEK